MEQVNRTRTAVMMVLGGMALFGFVDNFMRLAAEDGGLWQFHFLRGLIAVALILPLAWLSGARLRPVDGRAVIIRSFCNATAMLLYFGALGLMPIAQALAGLFTAPLFVVIFSALFFGEKIGARRIVAVLIGFAGVLLALRPDTSGFGVGTFLPVLAGAFYGMSNLLTRRWCAAEGTLTLLGGFFLFMAIWGALGCIFLLLWPLPVPAGAEGWAVRGWVMPGATFLGIIVMQAVGSLIGVGLVIRSYQLSEDSTLIAVLENALLVFATLWAIVLWKEGPDALGWLGLGLITVAGVIIAKRSRLRVH